MRLVPSTLFGTLCALAAWLPMQVHADTLHLKNVGFATPESVEYDAERDVYLVANINGSPFEKDDNGFISQISPEGEVLSLKWINGEDDAIELNAPKGMVAQNGKLFVADIDRIRVFDLKTRKQLNDIPVPNSTFLNGLSPAPNGGLYVTDSGLSPGFKPNRTQALYKVAPNGQLSKLKKGTLGNPNGVYAEGHRLWMVSMMSGQLRFMDLNGNEKARMQLPFNRLDGLLTTHDGRLITSSWQAQGVYEVTKDYHLKKIVGNLESPADLGYDTQRNRLLIPLFLKDELVIYPLN